MIPEALSGQWIGDLRGTSVGNIFAEFARDNDAVTVDIRVSPLTGGPAFAYTGTLQDRNGVVGADVKLSPTDDVAGHFTFSDIRDSHLSGVWETLDQNRGVFMLNRTASPVTTPQGAVVTEPLQIVQRTQSLPKFTIFRDELQELIKVMKDLVQTLNDAAMRAEIDGVDINRLATDFWALPSLPREVEYIHLSLSEQATFAPKTINVNLAATGCSFNVSGSSEVWVNGTFAKLDRFLARRRGFWRTVFEKHGLNLNGIALLLALTLGPSLDTPSRIVLVVATIGGIMLFKLGHAYATKLRIFLREDYKTTSFIDYPRLLTTILGVAVIAAVTGLYGWLSQGGLKTILDLLLVASGP